MDTNAYAVKAEHVVIRFNMASEKIDNLKEYFVKLVKRELLFQEFLAVKDASFQVHKGEAWGFIGVNGSGKSTLLKAICGILKPYKGKITVNGSIAPLIELGAGFDGDLTARENIFLNGAVLGHDKKFMEEHFDEIVEFAELQDFLICDEVLSVGDYAFQKKCEKRMNEMRAGGTTLLYVSHSIESVQQICDHALWLQKGVVKGIGEVDEIAKQYMDSLA